MDSKPATSPESMRSDRPTAVDPSPSGANAASPPATSAGVDFEPGARIGPYESIRLLGRGGMGAVYLARDTKLGRRVAIKLLRKNRPETTARFVLEARATARCSHENIVVIHEVDEHHGHPFMVLEYLRGTPLSTLMHDGRKIPPARAVELMVPVVRALACAHDHNIVHRDLKPDNIFITDSGTVKVLDFGIAKLVQDACEVRETASVGGDKNLSSGEDHAAVTFTSDDGAKSSISTSPIQTQEGARIGTVPYMSPEQWGADTIDHRTDLWAVGIILFKMVTGRHPLGSPMGPAWMITGALWQPMPRVHSVCGDVPDDLAEVIDRCLLKPKAERYGSARQLLAELEPFLPGRYSPTLRSDENPYPGLRAFGEADAGRFFGRHREVAAAVSRLAGQPLLGVVGPSGVGKSSFVRAGLVPALKRSGESFTARIVRPGRQPVAALARLVAHSLAETTGTSGTTLGDDSSEHVAAERLRAEPGLLGAVLRGQARQRETSILVYVDQFEELYTLSADPAERRTFTACLAGVADDVDAPLRVVLSIRSDFVDRVAEDEEFFAELGRGLMFLSAPDRAGMRDAVIQPAEMAGYRFESDAMVEHMLDHLEHTPGALPLLQFVASVLWEQRDPARRLITDAGYRELGGIAGALAGHADAVWAGFSSSDQRLAREVLLRLVTAERTRAVIARDELDELARSKGGERAVTEKDVGRVIDQLVHARLVVVHAGGDSADPTVGPGAATVELVHESLIASWPRLGHWLDAGGEDVAFLAQLRAAARQWQAKGRPGGLLWRGEALDEAKLWRRRYRSELPTLQQAYLDAVFALGDRTARRKRTIVAATIAVLSLLVTAAAVALLWIRDAERAAKNQATETRRQLDRARAAEAEAQLERENAVRAREEIARVNARLSSTNDELFAAARAAEAARKESEAARARAEAARLKARRDRRRAVDNERAAIAAEAKERQANQRLQRLLEQERARSEELANQGTTHAIPDVDIE